MANRVCCARGRCVAHALPPPLLAVPLAPGTVQTEMNLEDANPPAEVWAPLAVEYILKLARAAPKMSGASLSVPGFYDDAFRRSWIIADGQPLKDEPDLEERRASVAWAPIECTPRSRRQRLGARQAGEHGIPLSQC